MSQYCRWELQGTLHVLIDLPYLPSDQRVILAAAKERWDCKANYWLGNEVVSSGVADNIDDAKRTVQHMVDIASGKLPFHKEYELTKGVPVDRVPDWSKVMPKQDAVPEVADDWRMQLEASFLATEEMASNELLAMEYLAPPKRSWWSRLWSWLRSLIGRARWISG